MNIKSIITAALALLVSTACSGGARQENVMNKDGKAIVVFFSHAGDNYAVGKIEVGNTKIVADYITDLTGAEQFEIVTHNKKENVRRACPDRLRESLKYQATKGRAKELTP